MSRKKFSDATKAEAVALYKKGLGTPALAKRYGAAHTTVRTWLLKAGVEMRSAGRPAFSKDETERKKREAVRLYQDGMTAAVIGRQFKVSHQTVLNWLRAEGVEVRPRHNHKKPGAAKTTKAEAIAAILSIAEAHHLRVTVSA